MSKKVILSARQSGKAAVFLDQLLTRLMVIFLYRHRFTVKVSSLLASSVSFSVSPLCSVRLRRRYLLPRRVLPLSSVITVCFLAYYPPQPPSAAV